MKYEILSRYQPARAKIKQFYSIWKETKEKYDKLKW